MSGVTNKAFPEIEQMALLLKAMHFAARKHRHQRRKNAAKTPYINHPLEVAHILWFEGNIRNEDILAAAILHDTVEDTNTSFEEVERQFGKKIMSIVEEVTDDKSLPWEERKRRQVEAAPTLSDEAKLVKLADKISNLRDVYKDPPEGWNKERQIGYFRLSSKVIDGIRGTHMRLESLFDEISQKFFEEIANI